MCSLSVCLSQPASPSACLSVAAPPPRPSPSSGSVQAAGLKSDPGGRRPFLLTGNQDTRPQPPHSTDPSSSRRPVLGPPPAPCHPRLAALVQDPPWSGETGISRRDHRPLAKAFVKGYFRLRLEGGRARWESCPGTVHSELPGHRLRARPGTRPWENSAMRCPCPAPAPWRALSSGEGGDEDRHAQMRADRGGGFLNLMGRRVTRTLTSMHISRPQLRRVR